MVEPDSGKPYSGAFHNGILQFYAFLPHPRI